MTVARSTNIIVGFTSAAWATEIRMANGVTASTWSVMTKIDLTQTYPLNSSPGSSITSIPDHSFLSLRRPDT